MAWYPIETLKCDGEVVLLFSERWIDADFNPEGIREGFRNEDDSGPLYSARWNNCQDCWETDIGFEATHWTSRPAPPKVAAPYRCQYCGMPSWVEPAEQIAPVDYCHDDDHEPIQ